MGEQQKTVHLIVQRQDSPDSAPYTEEFIVAWALGMNVVSALMEVQKHPVNKEGKVTKPVVWDCNCLEEVCGACAMVINGKPRQACSCLVDNVEQPIYLSPLDKFPIVRDLIVDRQKMFDNLKKIQAWVAVDTTADLGPGPRMSREQQEEVYPLSRCMTCGCCMQACPNFNDKSEFIGPAPVTQVHLMNTHPTGAMQKSGRLEALMEPGGIVGCGNAQNCVEVCPKSIPLTTVIAKLNRQVNKFALSQLFDK